MMIYNEHTNLPGDIVKMRLAGCVFLCGFIQNFQKSSCNLRKTVIR